MGRILTLGPLLLLACVAGCARWTVESQASAGWPYGQYRTYAWVTPPGVAGVDPLLDQRVRGEIAARLARRGIAPAAAGATPDFIVNYTVVTSPLVQTVVADPGPTGVGASGATYTRPLPLVTTRSYAQGKLRIDFVDARSDRIFWRGFAAYAMDQPAELSAPKAAAAVGKILRRYPATQLAAGSRPSG